MHQYISMHLQNKYLLKRCMEKKEQKNTWDAGEISTCRNQSSAGKVPDINLYALKKKSL